MTLWMFDTSTRDLVYCDPQAGALRFGLGVVVVWANGDRSERNEAARCLPNALEVNLRKSLPRANNSNIVVGGGLKFR